jgi:predicted dehydrogenase
VLCLFLGDLNRYTPCNRKIKELIDRNVIGDLVNIQHTEPVGFAHFAHSYVRGNWRKENESTFALMAKCCHDVDLIRYWMSGASKSLPNSSNTMSENKVVNIASIGSLFHFKRANKPAEAGSAKR